MLANREVSFPFHPDDRKPLDALQFPIVNPAREIERKKVNNRWKIIKIKKARVKEFYVIKMRNVKVFLIAHKEREKKASVHNFFFNYISCIASRNSNLLTLRLNELFSFFECY